jgi:Protein of unknown function (DUF4012)
MKKLANSKIARLIFLFCIPLVWLFFVAMLALSRYDFVIGRAKNATNHIQTIQTIAKDIDIKKDLGNTDQLKAKLSQVKQEFKGIETEFATINAEVKRLRLPLTAAKITPLAPTIDTARFLTEAGDNFIKAGWEAFNLADIGIDVLTKFGKAANSNVNTAGGSLSGFGIDLDRDTLQELKKKLANTKQLINEGIRQFNQIPLDRLNKGSELERAVTELHRQLPNITAVLNEGERALATLEVLLGYGELPATYLVLVQDASETRPTGGFIGNYAVINVQYGKLGNFYFDNVYKLDDNYLTKDGNFLKTPDEYMSWWILPFRWGLRDVNLSPDFPETARYARELAMKLGAANKVDVVIGVNPKFVQDILRLTGDLRIKDGNEFDDVITADNIISKLHYYQLEYSSHEGAEFYQRKRFTKIFAETLIDKVKSLPKSEFVKIVEIALNSLETKDILVYSADSFAQKWLEAQGWAGRVERETTTAFGTSRDYFMMVDTSMSGNKVNSYIKQAAQDTVTFNPDGTTKHTLKLSYNYNGTPNFYEAGQNSGFYSYNRFYLPLNALMLNRVEFGRVDSPLEQYQKSVWGQTVGVAQTQHFQPTAEWHSPPEASGLGRDRNGRLTYNILVQRQPATELKYTLNVKPPEGYRVGAVVANDRIIPHSNPNSAGVVTVFNAPLLIDTEISVYFDPAK